MSDIVAAVSTCVLGAVILTGGRLAQSASVNGHACQHNGGGNVQSNDVGNGNDLAVLRPHCVFCNNEIDGSVDMIPQILCEARCEHGDRFNYEFNVNGHPLDRFNIACTVAQLAQALHNNRGEVVLMCGHVAHVRHLREYLLTQTELPVCPAPRCGAPLVRCRHVGYLQHYVQCLMDTVGHT